MKDAIEHVKLILFIAMILAIPVAVMVFGDGGGINVEDTYRGGWR